MIKENTKFGRLTAIKPDGSEKTICKCECGTIKSIYNFHLLSGDTKSCGCLARELSSKRNRRDLTGQVFGEITVIKDDGTRNSSGNIMWLCKCSCGEIYHVRGSHLTNGSVKRCSKCKGKNQIKDLTKEKFGKLTPIKYNNETHKWICKCECGNSTEVSSYNLQRENGTKSCGCLKSFGEYQIMKLLNENNIKYIKEYSFESCVSDNNVKLRFDFYIENKYLIEYDGEQHYKLSENSTWNNKSGTKLEENQKRDAIKNNWCKENNIPLIRIPYTHLKNLCLEDLLLETSEFLI